MGRQNERVDIPSHHMEHTHHHVSALVMGLRHWDFPRSSRGVVELVPRDQALHIHIIATSDSRSSRYRGWTVLLFKSSEKACHREIPNSYSKGRCTIVRCRTSGKAWSKIVGLTKSQIIMNAWC